MKNIAIKIYNWLVYSSQDPERYSTTIKGLSAFIGLGLLTTVNQVFGLHLEQIDLVNALNQIALITSLGLTLFGVARKFIYAVIGIILWANQILRPRD